MKNSFIRLGLFLTTVVLIVLSIVGCMSTKQNDAEESYPVSQIQHGRQLVAASNCSDCHSPKIWTPEDDLTPDPERLMSGHPEGTPLPDLPYENIGAEGWESVVYTTDMTVWVGPWGVSFTANLTPDADTGIGSWTPDMFIETMRTGKHMGLGRELIAPMPWEDYANYSDDDLMAIYAYLRTLKPIGNRVPAPIAPDDELFK
jgi:hypothetical protein